MKNNKLLSTKTTTRRLVKIFATDLVCDSLKDMRVKSRFFKLKGVRRGMKLVLPAVLIAYGLSVSTADAGERRVAFVVGNSGYQTVPALPNPKNDAAAVAEALKNRALKLSPPLTLTALDLTRPWRNLSVRLVERI